MSVYNAVGEGPASSPQEVFVGEAGMYTSCHSDQNSLIQELHLTSCDLKLIKFSGVICPSPNPGCNLGFSALKG